MSHPEMFGKDENESQGGPADQESLDEDEALAFALDALAEMALTSDQLSALGTSALGITLRIRLTSTYRSTALIGRSQRPGGARHRLRLDRYDQQDFDGLRSAMKA